MAEGNIKPIDLEQLEALCRNYMDIESCAAFFKVSVSTISNRIRETYDQTFTEYRDSCFVVTRNALISVALDMALNKKNTKMLTHCLNNLCGWKSPLTFNPSAKTSITLNYNLNDNEDDVDNPVEKIVEPSPPEQIPEDTTGSGS